MTQAVATFATMPQTLEEVTKLGRFSLRALGEEIPAYNSGDERQAFLKLETAEQAAAIHKAAVARRAAEKGGGKPAATPKAATRTPVNAKSAPKESAPTQSAPSSEAGGNFEQLLNALSEIKQSQERLEEKIDEILAGQEALQLQGAGNNKLVQVAATLSLSVAETVCNAPLEAVLRDAIERLPEVEAILTEVLGLGGGSSEDDQGNG